MKRTKKLFSLALAFIMAMALMTPAFATQEGTLTGGSITINDAVPGQVYNAYQILYLESYNADTNAYAYKANGAWESWLRTQTNYVHFDDQGYVTWVKVLVCDIEDAGHTHGADCYTDADAAAFAKLAQVEAAKMTADATATAPAAAKGETYSTVEFKNLKLGYYLVDTTLGTLCSLDTTNPSVEMYEKNEVPTNVKTVQEDSKSGNDAWGTTNDADIGQTVNFKSTITAKKGAENYVFHDTMSAGLTLDKASIKVGGVAVTNADGSDLSGDNYVVSYPSGDGSDGCTFEIAFAQSYLNSITEDTTIVITYSATVNSSAVVGLPGNPNESKLSYGDSSKTTTTLPSETITYTWDMDILKYANGDENKVLADAQFVLLNSAKNKVATVVNGKITGWANVPAAGQDGSIAWPDNTVLTTNASGKIEIDGLDADTYYLREVKAPNGYNKLANDIEVVITGATTEGGALTYTTVVAKVNNQSGAELPSTGGMGTTIFYVLGGVLMAGAAILLVTKKKMSNEQ